MKKVLEWIAIAGGGIVGIFLIIVAILYFNGKSKFSKVYNVTPRLTSVPLDISLIERGKHLSIISGCQYCHGENFGGKVFLDIPPFRLIASNLTSGQGGIGKTYQDGDWDKAIRFGIRPDGTLIFPVMPYKSYNRFGDSDAKALIAYVKNIPEVDNNLPSTEMRAPIYIQAGLPNFDLSSYMVDPETSPQKSVKPGPTKEYGKYMAAILCAECHGDNYLGGKHPDPEGPKAPSLKVISGWSMGGFAKAIRTGITPANRNLDSNWMPWEFFKNMTDEELQALYIFFKELD